MREIIEYPYQGKSYFNVCDALEDLGYEAVELSEEELILIDDFEDVFTKNGKYYGFLGMYNYNTTIYDITLVEVDEISELSEYCAKEKIKELECLIGETFSLRDMDCYATNITGFDEPSLACGDYYEINEIPIGEEWAYGYGKSGGIEGCFLVDFEILEKPECIEDWDEIEDVLVKVVDVRLA